MSKEEQGVQAHPQGEVEIADDQAAETVTSLDTFAGKIHVKWSPEATVSSLGLMPFFIEFLKTSGLFDKWVEDCPLHYTSANAPEKRNVLGTLLLSVVAVSLQKKQRNVAGGVRVATKIRAKAARSSAVAASQAR